MLERLFHLAENRTSVRTELLAGVTTFLTMAYIIFVQPAVLSGLMFNRPTGMDFGAVTTATCLAAALATLIMAFYARYPIAQAPGMGENFFFVFSAIPAATAAGFADGWEVALGTVFVSGMIFLALTWVGLRQMIFNAVSPNMKHGIAAGIGLFIAFIGLQNTGLILKDSGTAVRLNPHFGSPDLIVFFVGLLTTAVLRARKVSGSILWGIGAATLLAVSARLALPHLPEPYRSSPVVAGSMLKRQFQFATGIVALPPSLGPTCLKMDLVHALSPAMWPVVFVFLFMLTFDRLPAHQTAQRARTGGQRTHLPDGVRTLALLRLGAEPDGLKELWEPKPAAERIVLPPRVKDPNPQIINPTGFLLQRNFSPKLGKTASL